MAVIEVQSTKLVNQISQPSHGGGLATCDSSSDRPLKPPAAPLSSAKVTPGGGATGAIFASGGSVPRRAPSPEAGPSIPRRDSFFEAGASVSTVAALPQEKNEEKKPRFSSVAGAGGASCFGV